MVSAALGQYARTVEFQLEEPTFAREGLFARGREHGLEVFDGQLLLRDR